MLHGDIVMLDTATSTWQVFKLDDPRTTYELYGSGSAPLGRLFGAGRFDRAVTMLLACAKEVRNYVGPRPFARQGHASPSCCVPLPYHLSRMC